MNSEKFIPRSEDIAEEEKRLTGGDPGSHFKTGKPYKRSFKESIPDSDEDIEEKMADIIDNKKNNEDEILTKTELLKQQIVNDIKKEEKIGFLQNSPDVAHIGPEFYKEGKNAENNENESLYADMEDLEKQPSFLSKIKYLINKPFFYRKSEHNRNTGRQKDNLKTISDDQRERLSRDKIREVLHNSEQ